MRACTADEMRAIDQRAIDEFGMPGLLLMENAGAAVARRAAEIVGDPRNPRRGTIVVLCGKGNNGGDGFVAARHLWTRGHNVRCFHTAEIATMEGDARVNAELAVRIGVPTELFQPDLTQWSMLHGDNLLRRSGLVIDALLGTGFTGQPHGLVERAIEMGRPFNGTPVLAVDVPSGVDATTGSASQTSFGADETVTFGLPKVGLLTGEGRRLAGAITIAEIALPRTRQYELDVPLLWEEEPSTEWVEARWVVEFCPARCPDAHKGYSGRLLVLAGSPGLTGAAALTATSALRTGAGLVTVAIPKGLASAMAVKLTEAMTLPLPETESGAHSPASLEAIGRD